MQVLRRIMRQTSPLHQVRVVVVLLHVLILSSARTLAQGACGATQTTPIRVENASGVGKLLAAVSCTDGGEVVAEWAGHVPIGAPITVTEGTFLSVTGKDELAEVHGDSSQTNVTRLFEVSPGGSLTLTRLKLSGGSAGGGGAIYSQSASLTLDNCTFGGNVATDGDGGAVWADGGNVTIVGGVFLANNATRFGGAVYAVDGRLVVQGGSGFEGNKAIGGGAIFCGVEDEVGASKMAAYCSITDAEFVSNSAARERQDLVGYFADLDGGGAAMFRFASVEITDSVFSWNYALLSGGALHGGFDTNVSVNGCKFVNNTSEKYGGAISASSVVLAGSTEVANNLALDDGGAVFGWDVNGTIVFNDVLCSENSASNNGGCFYGFGTGIFNDGTAMLDNSGGNGGSILAAEGSDITVTGGNYTCRSSERGGFLYAKDNTRVNITGGLFENSVVTKRGGALYCNGNEETYISIAGGTFRNNNALMGGAIAVWGAPAVVKITGGIFENNKAKYYGGFVFIEEGASFSCDGVTIRGISADDQGGGIYARAATWVNSSCHLISNESPQGAAIYLTNVKSATFEDHNVTDNLASGESVVHVAASTVVARGVRFESGVDLQDHSFNRAVHLDGNTTLDAEKCVFDGWLGDTVIFNANSADGSLVLDSCDFSGSSATFAVISPNSDAEIRNAVVSNFTFENAFVNGSLVLVDRALDCSDSNACGPGECVDSALGVLCECLEGGECLHDGGELSLHLQTPPDNVTYSPDTVSYELAVSAAATGTTYAIWELGFEGGDLALDVVPSSGILHPGSSVTVTVTGTPSNQDVAGGLTQSFQIIPHSNFTTYVGLDVSTTFYLCRAYKYAMPVDGDDDDNNSVSCEPCAAINGEEGVDCDSPGATRASLPIRQGFWRSDFKSMVVRKCLHPWACKGGTEISSSDDYCAHRHNGPYCAVCTEGHGKSLSNSCHSCDGTNARLLITACALFSLMMVVLLLLAVVFLIGGLDAVDIVRQSTIPKMSRASKASRCWRPVRRRGLPSHTDSDQSSRIDACDEPIAHGVDHARQCNPVGGEVGANFGGESTLQRCERDEFKPMPARPLGAVVAVGDGVPLSSVTGRHTAGEEATAAGRHTQRCSLAGTGVSEPVVHKRLDVETSGGMASKCCMFGKKIIRRVQMLPLNKFKILVGVWQILAVFSSITGVEFPASYLMFLSWINVLNFDLGYILSASCVLPSVNFHHRLLATTLAPFAMVAGLVLTYRIANGRAGIGSAGVIAKRAAWSRHLSAGLFITFVVFTSASSLVLNTFPCDDKVVDGESYLIADYSISCHTRLHSFFRAYAGIMVLVYPIGIPVLYSVVLWKHRELLNPRIHDSTKHEVDDATESVTRARSTKRDGVPSAIHTTVSKGQSQNESSPLKPQELEERVRARTEHPELVPFMFLWRDFDPNLYYYEVIECGRRIFLTDVLIFIAPHTVTQAAFGCIFAFVNLLVFELTRPHLDPTDSWLYRLGCVLIFLTMFLAMLIKMGVAGEANRSAFGVCLVALNVLLVLAVLWFATRHMVRASDEEGNTSA